MGGQQPMYGDYGYNPNNIAPYQDRRVSTNFQPSYQLGQTPQAFQPPQPPIAGRWVGDMNEITPREVPMDGSVAFFPLKDYSKILAKAWDQNGTIKTVEYVPVVDESSASNEQDTPLQQLNKRLDKLEDMLQTVQDRLGKQTTKKGD